MTRSTARVNQALHDPIYDKVLYDADYCDGRDWNFYRYALAKCIEKGKPGTILDLGAGLGYFAECCARFSIPCIAAEGSLYGLAQARLRWPELSLICCDLSVPLPLQNECFAMIVCNQVIEHLPAAHALPLLSECHRVLQKDGVLFLYTPSKYNWVERKKEHHINLLTPKGLEHLLRVAGFIDLERLNFPYPYLGNSGWGRLLMTALFKLAPFDFLSSSANFIARKRH
jgi:SAM-dependent methyltransferase